jgi:hypothetical protein
MYLSLSFFFFVFLALAWALCFWLIFLKAKLIFLTSSLNQSLPMKTIQTSQTKDQVHFHQWRT